MTARDNLQTPMQRVHMHKPSCPQFPTPTSCSTATNFTVKPRTGRRRDSGELDVFEAARYFSGDIDGLIFGLGAATKTRATTKEEIIKAARTNTTPERKKKSKNLEIPAQQAATLNAPLEKKLKSKTSKPPRSPAAKLASYLNGLILQKATKKTSNEEEEERRSMRSSDSKSVACSYKGKGTEGLFEKIKESGCSEGLNEKSNSDGWGFLGRERGWRRRRFKVDDDGGSESSSELFELRNIELKEEESIRSSGMEKIEKGHAIASVGY